METETQLSSKSIFHYTDLFENLISIISEGIRPKFNLEEFHFFDNNANNIEGFLSQMAFPISCFCDIPIKLADKHRKVYGDYCIAFNKNWGLNNLITPVWYLSLEFAKVYFKNLILNSYDLESKIEKRQFKYSNKELDFLRDDQLLDIKIKTSIFLIKQLFFYTKPYIGPFERKRTNYVEKNYKFYDEREWRYKPKINIGRSFLTKDEFCNKEILNLNNANLNPLKFNISDIDIVFVKEKSEKIKIIEILNKKFGEIPNILVQVW